MPAWFAASGQALPSASIYVYDNNSADATRAVAESAGATVRRQALQGKGHVVRRMFSDIEADIYLLVDGDDTYDAGSAPLMIEKLLAENLDMVVGRRVDHDTAAYRRGHRFGNAMLTGAVSRFFGNRFTDILSGYRVFSKRFVKSVPILAKGFEIETEITVHALTLQMPIAEVDTAYKSRPEGSASKLHTVRDGTRILVTILRLLRAERPLLFFSTVAAGLFLVAVLLAIPIFITYLEQGIVPRLPTAVLCTGLTLLSFLHLVTGLVLENVTRGRREVRMLAYLGLPCVNPAVHGHCAITGAVKLVKSGCLITFQYPDKHVPGNGLSEISRTAYLAPSVYLILQTFRGQHDDGRAAGSTQRLFRADALGGFVSGAARHIDVHQNQIETAAQSKFDRFHPVLGADQRALVGFQIGFYQEVSVVGVIRDQNTHTTRRFTPGSLVRRPAFFDP